MQLESTKVFRSLFEELLCAFFNVGDLSFSAFKLVWSEHGLESIYKRINECKTRVNLSIFTQISFDCILRLLYEPVQDCPRLSSLLELTVIEKVWNVGVLYTLYAMHNTQPVSHRASVQIGPAAMKALLSAAKDCYELQEFGSTAVAFYKHMWQTNSFLCCSYSGPTSVYFSTLPYTNQSSNTRTIRSSTSTSGRSNSDTTSNSSSNDRTARSRQRSAEAIPSDDLILLREQFAINGPIIVVSTALLNSLTGSGESDNANAIADASNNVRANNSASASSSSSASADRTVSGVDVAVIHSSMGVYSDVDTYTGAGMEHPQPSEPEPEATITTTSSLSMTELPSLTQYLADTIPQRRQLRALATRAREQRMQSETKQKEIKARKRLITRLEKHDKPQSVSSNRRTRNQINHINDDNTHGISDREEAQHTRQRRSSELKNPRVRTAIQQLQDQAVRDSTLPNRSVATRVAASAASAASGRSSSGGAIERATRSGQNKQLQINIAGSLPSLPAAPISLPTRNNANSLKTRSRRAHDSTSAATTTAAASSNHARVRRTSMSRRKNNIEINENNEHNDSSAAARNTKRRSRPASVLNEDMDYQGTNEMTKKQRVVEEEEAEERGEEKEEDDEEVGLRRPVRLPRRPPRPPRQPTNLPQASTNTSNTSVDGISVGVGTGRGRRGAAGVRRVAQAMLVTPTSTTTAEAATAAEGGGGRGGERGGRTLDSESSDILALLSQLEEDSFELLGSIRVHESRFSVTSKQQQQPSDRVRRRPQQRRSQQAHAEEQEQEQKQEKDQEEDVEQAQLSRQQRGRKSGRNRLRSAQEEDDVVVVSSAVDDARAKAVADLLLLEAALHHLNPHTTSTPAAPMVPTGASAAVSGLKRHRDIAQSVASKTTATRASRTERSLPSNNADISPPRARARRQRAPVAAPTTTSTFSSDIMSMLQELEKSTQSVISRSDTVDYVPERAPSIRGRGSKRALTSVNNENSSYNNDITTTVTATDTVSSSAIVSDAGATTVSGRRPKRGVTIHPTVSLTLTNHISGNGSSSDSRTGRTGRIAFTANAHNAEGGIVDGTMAIPANITNITDSSNNTNLMLGSNNSNNQESSSYSDDLFAMMAELEHSTAQILETAKSMDNTTGQNEL